MISRRKIEREHARNLANGVQSAPYPDDVERPKRRADCRDGPRPCPFVACKYHLFLDITEWGSIQFNVDEDPAVIEEMPHTCALDVADRGEHTCAFVSEILSVTPANVQHIEDVALIKLKGAAVDDTSNKAKSLGHAMLPKRQRALQLIDEGLTRPQVYAKIKEEYGSTISQAILRALFVAYSRQQF